MGLLERAIRRGVSDAVGKAIGKAIEPTVTDMTNRAANAIDRSAQNAEQQVARSSGLDDAMANLERSVQGYATEAAKNVKVCASCGKPTAADTKFCPECGAKLPEQTVAQGAVCSNCGKQNAIGTKFCRDCGTKLPAAIAEEQAQAERNAAVMAEWEEKLPQYPKWTCGGTDYVIDEYDAGCFGFTACFEGNSYAARRAVDDYRQILMQNGFKQAGEYPCIEHLYKKENGICCHVDTGMCFEASEDCPSIAFDNREPRGGFDYVKPEARRRSGFKGLLGL